jgi:hypothetical protein
MATIFIRDSKEDTPVRRARRIRRNARKKIFFVLRRLTMTRAIQSKENIFSFLSKHTVAIFCYPFVFPSIILFGSQFAAHKTIHRSMKQIIRPHPIVCVVMAVVLSHIRPCPAFLTPTRSLQPRTTCLWVGGKGWENNNYLDSLSGNDADRERAQQEYQEFQDSRQAFLHRQQARRQTPEGQRFLREQQQQRMQQQSSFDDDDDGTGDFFAQLGESSGGSRFRKVLQQAQRQQQQQKSRRTTFIDPATGLEMKFAVPLDEDEEGR